LALHNVNATMAIVSGLQSTAIYRLKQTWAQLPSKAAKSFEEMAALVSGQRNFFSIALSSY
jgi:hypothetical protein